MKYYRKYWDESRGDEYCSWGVSDWWFEVEENGYVIRCIQIYKNGNVLSYSKEHNADKYGSLPEGVLELESGFEITKEEFENTMSKCIPINI